MKGKWFRCNECYRDKEELGCVIRIREDGDSPKNNCLIHNYNCAGKPDPAPVWRPLEANMKVLL